MSATFWSLTNISESTSHTSVAVLSWKTYKKVECIGYLFWREAYPYLWSCDVDVGDPNKAHLSSCKRQNHPCTTSCVLLYYYNIFNCLSWYCSFENSQLNALEYTVYCTLVPVFYTLLLVFLPPWLQTPMLDKELGGKGPDLSSQGSWVKNSGRWMSRWLWWQAPLSNPVANVGT